MVTEYEESLSKTKRSGSGIGAIQLRVVALESVD